jgi:hypothetical protein
MKCWNSTFNAQGSKGIIIGVKVGVVKIYVVARCSRKKKDNFKFKKPSEFHPPLNAYLFLCNFFNLTLFMTKFREWVLSFLNFIGRSIMLDFITQIFMAN